MAVTTQKLLGATPKTSKKTKKSRVSARFRKGKRGRGPRVEGNIAVTISKSSKRMHQAAKITAKRPEILAMLDFKPLYASGGDLTMAGKMFKARVTERSQTLESIQDTLKELQETLPDEFTAAVNQYASALAATEADIALLKLMILLREYATRACRFKDFRDEYEPPEELEVSLFGETPGQQVRNVLKIKARGNNPFWKYAAAPFLQILSDLSLCGYAILPSQMSRSRRNAGQVGGVAQKFASYKREALPLLTLAFVVRDMVASYEFMKLKIGDEIDDDFLAVCETVLGESFWTSNTTQQFPAFKKLTGIDVWQRMRRSTDTDKAGLTKYQKTKIGDVLRNKQGVIGKSTKRQGREMIFMPETIPVIYSDKEYLTIDGLVDEAFAGDEPLNFDNFNETVGGFTKSMHDLETFGKTLFRLGEKAEGYGPAPRDYPLVADEMPFSLGSSAAVVADVFNRRFVDSFRSSAMKDWSEWLGEGHVQYNRMIAWFVLRDDYERAYGFLSALISDYENGFLTAAGMPEEIIIDEETGESELTPTSFVLPGTTTPASLSTVGTRLGSKLSRMDEWFDGKKGYSPLVDKGGNTEEGYPTPEPGYQLNRRILGTNSGGDLRYVNPMYICKTDWWNETEPGYTYKGWRGIKIVGCEIIDAVLEVMRALMAPMLEVEAVPDGDPIFPSLTESKTPYGTGSWSFCDPMYEPMGTELWVPTIEAWYSLFARKSTKDTYFRSASLKAQVKNICRTLAALMADYDMIQIRTAGYTTTETIEGIANLTYGNAISWTRTLQCAVLAVKGDDNWEWEKYSQFWKNAGNSVNDLLASSWDKIDDVSYEKQGERDNFAGKSDTNKWLRVTHNTMKNFLIDGHKNDVGLEFLYDFIGSYATRVDNYNLATQALVEGDDSALGTFVQSVRDAGDAGIDLLQNISPNQLALKQIALDEERGDEDKAYLPQLAILTRPEVRAVKFLARQQKAVSPEGDNAKIVIVGLPAGIFEALEIDDKFGIRVSYVDIEYPQIVFRGKVYPFRKDVYVDQDDLEISLKGVDSFDDIVKKIKYSKLAVEIEESNDTTAMIEVSDDVSRLRYSKRWRSAATNHASSEVLKMYCRIMLGLNFSESAILGTPDGIQIPINDYAADLASAMAAGLETISGVSTELASATTDVLSDLTVIEEDAFVSGELEAVDEALITNLRDAFQTRLFSAEVMRSRVMSAKLFDRIFALVIDPDEFYVVTPDDVDESGVTTPQNILDFYLGKGIIEETGLDAPFQYKLAPRTTGEGRMAFGKFFVSVVSAPTQPDRILR